MDKKQVVSIAASGAVCLLIGVLFGYIAGTNTVPGMQLSGADFSSLVDQQQMEQMNRLDGQMTENMEKVEQQNALLKEAREHLFTLREYQYSGRTTAPEPSIVSFFELQGIPCLSGNSDRDYSEQDWRDMEDNLSTFIDSLQADSQLDMIRLQSLMNKRNQTMEMMSNLLRTHQQSRDAIIGNMR